MNKWIIVSFGSLTAVSLFSMYIGNHLARGILCNYVYMTPYLMPVIYILGFFLGYSIPQLLSKINKNDLAELFSRDEKEVILIALNKGLQTEVSKKIGKVKSHRTIRALENKGLVIKEKKGKTYTLKPGKKLQKII